MKRNKGISLITLVITIIIMIILAATIVLTLTNSGIFDKANDAVSKYSLKQVQAIADLAWSEAYADGARDRTSLQAAVDEALNKNKLNDKYKAVADEKGVTVTEKVQGGNTAVVPDEWQDYVSDVTVDNVPIPVGFVKSPYGESENYPAENTNVGGLVIYALTPDEIERGETDILSIDGQNGKLTEEEAHYVSLTTRNQFVWVPVDDFKNDFVRKSFGQMIWVYDEETGEGSEVPLELSKELGVGYWELILDDDNMPADNTKNTTNYVSKDTLDEATAMYNSVAEYGGFYIARYEVGYSYDDKDNKVPSITMGKYPYNHVCWSYSKIVETANDGGAVALSREFYPSTGITYGVVSTLTYQVQWDTTLNWWTGKDLTDSTSYGNYLNTAISLNEYNKGAQYISYVYDEDTGEEYSVGSWNNAIAKKEYDRCLLTTGACKKANVNNIYDMAGNLYEWTMEGAHIDYGDYFEDFRGICGGGFGSYGTNYPVGYHNGDNPLSRNSSFGFRPSLYIKY